MPEAEAPDVVVIRFRPYAIVGLQNSVVKQVTSDEIKARKVRHGVSVFADSVRDDEEFDEAVRRLCEAARAHAGGPKVAVTTEAALKERGYCLYEAIPPELHYLLGGKDIHSPPPPLEDLADLFAADVRDNPVFEKG